MKSVRLAAAFCVALVLSSCDAPRPEECILGRWEDKDHTPLEFRRDGAVVGQVRVGKINVGINGKYRFRDETTITVEDPSPHFPKGLTTFKVNRLDYRELSLTAQNGTMTIWTRPTQ